MKTLVVTNDFPPRAGGIQTFVRSLLEHFEPADVAVFSSTSPGAAQYDAQTPFEVIRAPTSMMLPTADMTRRAVQAMRQTDADRVWFGAAAPLGLMAPALRRAGARVLVGSTHGHETGWAQLPLARQLLQRIATGLDAMTYITNYTERRLRAAIGQRTKLAQVSPGVNIDRFNPDLNAQLVRDRYGLGSQIVIGCISRLVPRKGQDVLIKALPAIRAVLPSARLLLVGSGHDEQRLHDIAARAHVLDYVTFTGSVPAEQLPHYYAAVDVFAMPCRTRRAGLDVEGLGMVFLEAAATAKPVVAGNSGGAPEAVRDGETGRVVSHPRSAEAVAAAILEVLDWPGQGAQAGLIGREWVVQSWTWKRQADRLKELLADHEE